MGDLLGIGIGTVALVASIGVTIAVLWWVRSLQKAVGPTPTFQDMNDSLKLASSMTARTMARDALRANGVRTRIVLLEHRSTGQEWASAPIHALRVRITEGPHTGQEVTVREAVPLPVVEMLEPGKALTAQVDADDPRELAINW